MSNESRFPRIYALLKAAGHGPELITGQNFLEDRVRTAEFDADQLERLMVAAFELLGKPEDQSSRARQIHSKSTRAASIRRSKTSRSGPEVTPRSISSSDACALSA
jgi:hypothetical protein